MRILVMLAIVGAMFSAYNAHLIPGLNKPVAAFANDGSAQIMLITAQGCGNPCKSIVADLRKRQAKFKELELPRQQNDSADVLLWKKAGRPNLPFLIAGEYSSTVTSSPEVAAVLAKTYGQEHLLAAEQALYKTHFDSAGDPKVVIYGADWCGYCQRLTKALSADNIAFVEVDVPKHPNKKALVNTMGISGYPSTWYGNFRVRGSDIKAVKRTMKMASS